MSWGGAFAGAGRAAASIANKYIDEELAQERARVLADLQLESERKREEYQQSPEVQGRRNSNATAATLAAASATRQAATEGVNDSAYQGALTKSSELETGRRVASEVAMINGTTPTKIEAANQVEDGTRASRLTTARETAKIEADWRIRVSNATPPVEKDPLAGWTPQEKARLAGIDNELNRIHQEVTKAKATADGWAPDKNPGQADLEKRVQTLRLQRDALLNSAAGPSDPLGARGTPAKEPTAPDKPPAKGQPEAAPLAPASAAGAVPAAAATPPKASGEPGLLGRAWNRVKELGVDYSTPEGVARLRARIEEAKAGGPPLTSTEALRARQLENGTLPRIG